MSRRFTSFTIEALMTQDDSNQNPVEPITVCSQTTEKVTLKVETKASEEQLLDMSQSSVQSDISIANSDQYSFNIKDLSRSFINSMMQLPTNYINQPACCSTFGMNNLNTSFKDNCANYLAKVNKQQTGMSEHYNFISLSL